VQQEAEKKLQRFLSAGRRQAMTVAKTCDARAFRSLAQR